MMKSFLIIAFSLIIPITVYSQGNSNSNRVPNSTELPVIIDPILQSYEWIVNQSSAKIDKSIYKLGFGDVITVITKGSFPIILKSHVITSSEEIYIPQVGFISLRNKTIHEAEDEIERVLSLQYDDIRSEITLELPKQVSVNIYFPDGKLIRGKHSSISSFINVVMEAISDDNRQIDDPLKTARPQTPADNALLKSGLVQTPFDDKNIDQQSSKDLPELRVFDFRNYTFDFKDVLVKYADNEDKSLDLFEEWIADDFVNLKQLGSNANIYLKPKKNYASIFSLSGNVKKSFVIPFGKTDNYKKWIRNVLLSDDGQWSITADNVNYQFSDTTEVFQQIDSLLNQNNKFIGLQYQNSSSTFVNNKSGFWHYNTVSNQFNFVNDINLSTYLNNSSDYLASYVLIRNTDWTNNTDRLNRLFIEDKNPLMEDQLDYLQYLRQADSAIPVNPSLVGEEFCIPSGYILVSFTQTNTVKLMGQFVQPGQFQFMSQEVQKYLELGGGLSTAATGKIYIIKSGSFAWMNPEDTVVEAGDIIYAERIPLDNFQANRLYEIQAKNLRADRERLLVAAIGTVLSTITTIFLIMRN